MKTINSLIDREDKIDLAHSFYDACSNKDFKDFVMQIDLPQEILQNYTSSLQDAYIESCHCKKCKGLLTCKNKVKGYYYYPIKENKILNFSFVACDKLKEKEQKEMYKKNIEFYEMPKELLEASLKNVYKDDKARFPIIKYFGEFMETYTEKNPPKGIYLTGSFGSGKTYLIAALFNEMAKKNCRSVMVYYPEFLRSLKSSFQTDYTDKFNYIKKVPLLLLDDIGAENCSSWSRDEVLGPILQYRMENHLSTFFTSNLTIEELETALSITNSGPDRVKARRIIERIKQLTVNLELVSKNRRN